MTADINECMEGVHMCNETEDCIDTEGSYSCECMRGFHRIDQHCESKPFLMIKLVSSLAIYISRTRDQGLS